jgi:hypothetical protein
MSEKSKNLYVIEVASKTNQNLKFGPLGVQLRGRWDHARAARFPLSETAQLGALFEVAPVIPGQHIYLDLDRNVAGAFDPLRETESGRRMWAKIEAHFRKAQGRNVQPAEKVEISGLSPDQRKDFLYWMVRTVEDGKAEVVDSSAPLPPLDEVKAMPGKRTLNHGWVSHDPETRRFEEQYEFAVPVSSGNNNGGGNRSQKNN